MSPAPPPRLGSHSGFAATAAQRSRSCARQTRQPAPGKSALGGAGRRDLGEILTFWKSKQPVPCPFLLNMYAGISDLSSPITNRQLHQPQEGGLFKGNANLVGQL
ncbi:hypothetical protein Y1Q_0000324 [Alligator mississippiensis]|uniref:Uncharacterized protein n=1 Tax=Alligator mississippiensis TaxID=8496 RepID=A0A151LZB8_ALLMI|nr:hypothetical protein Y1Q_0000324 [Alligator mississippiensis]